MKKLILASSSVFRKSLLQKLDLPFTTLDPHIDETAKPSETAAELVQRLATEKARAVSKNNPHALIIGADEVAKIDNTILGKPLNHQQAVMQLQHVSGKTMNFYTSLCLLDTSTQQEQLCVATYSIKFRSLTLGMIQTYLRKEQPYQSTGSIKAEGLAIALFEYMHGDDYNALIGLPLIQLVTMLKRVGVEVLS